MCFSRNLDRAIGLALAAASFGVAQAADVEWEFGADLSVAGFSNSNAYFGNDTGYLGDEIGRWQEFGLEPWVGFEIPAGKGTAFGALSVVATYTLGDDASGLTIGIQTPSDATLEQGHLGWRAEDVVSWLDGETFTVTVGSLDYSIGSGMIINDGGSDGAERGAWYLSMRKSFQEAVLVELETDTLTLEAFRLKNRPRDGGPQGEAFGVNAEVEPMPDTRIGGSLLSVDANTNTGDRLAVISGRFDRAPATGFGFSAEVVSESNDQVDALGGFVQLSYAPDGMRWAPRFSYRYAAFSGDDPLTAKDERFHELAYGYTDYGSWYQGEITGDYPLGNGNLISHLVRVELHPAETVTLNALYYRFSFDQPASFGATAADWGDELDLTVDWEYSDQLYLVGVLAWLAPGEAAVQIVGGDQDWGYAMISAAFSW
jgi:hypothetical protein